jgi:predicted ATPase/DNA-binding winged helix-turn-helix (wHTH) protein
MDLIRVGDFEVQPGERVLSLHGKPLELGARAFNLLLALIEHEGRLASKAALIERVWPRLVVDENNLPAQIASLRRVLGAGAIRTVPGFGYRLELSVSRPTGAAVATARAPGHAAPQPLPLSTQRQVLPGLAALVGREQDLRAVHEALVRCRAVSIVGAAGIGKTRLAQEVLASGAEDHALPAAWVSLQAHTEIQHVAAAIALALGLSFADGVDGFTALAVALERTTVLLILDGAELVRDSLAAALATLLERTQGVRVLVTSQVPLGLRGESVYRLGPLSVPAASAPADPGVRGAAVELFVLRATAADQRFELTGANQAQVAELCRRLDGNPLAIELAAARVPALGVGTLLARLADRFRLLRSSGPVADPRHSALVAAFDWSYNLLNPVEQRAFDRLGAFAGSFSLEAAARCIADESTDTVEAIDVIGRLVDRSLVTALPMEPPRYQLLETARQYALGRLLAAAQLSSAQARMATTMLHLLDTAYEEYWSLDEVLWLHRYAPEIDNVRLALDWAGAYAAPEAVALYGSAWPLFVETDLSAEGRARFDHAVTLLTDALPRERVARFWEAVATYESARQFDRARYAAELAANMHAQIGASRAHYYALMLLALNWRGDDAAARAAADAAHGLEQPTWPARLLTHGALTEGALLMSSGEWSQARALYQRAVKFALTVSERQAVAASVSIVELDITCGDLAAALQLGRPLTLSLRHSGRRETRFELLVLTFSALLLAGELAEARSAAGELYTLALRLDTSRLYTTLDAMAYLACASGRYAVAERVLECADRVRAARGQARRRPVDERLRTRVLQLLEQRASGSGAPSDPLSEGEVLDETAACALVLGLTQLGYGA